MLRSIIQRLSYIPCLWLFLYSEKLLWSLRHFSPLAFLVDCGFHFFNSFCQSASCPVTSALALLLACFLRDKYWILPAKWLLSLLIFLWLCILWCWWMSSYKIFICVLYPFFTLFSNTIFPLPSHGTFKTLMMGRSFDLILVKGNIILTLVNMMSTTFKMSVVIRGWQLYCSREEGPTLNTGQVRGDNFVVETLPRILYILAN